jgi:hypothetical protein
MYTYIKIIVILACIVLCTATAPAAHALTLYNTPQYQSLVDGEPDDLLLLPGYGFANDDTVVYQLMSNSTAGLTPPAGIPSTTTAITGVAPVASIANVPDSLTVHLPPVMKKDQTYALWVRNSSGAWSNGIKINDARPIWITPDRGHATALSGGLATRYLKVVGRNLQPAGGAVTQVKLVGPSTFTLIAAAPSVIQKYVAAVTLPATMPVGSYRIQVSRDGVSWVALTGQSFTVLPDPKTPRSFNVSSPEYGGCRPNVNADATKCIVNAIKAAASAGGGSVIFGPGVWNMTDSISTGIYQYPDAGVVVPVGVNLIGSGANSTTIIRGPNWNPDLANNWTASFVLLGNNKVQGFTFKDMHTYVPTDGGLQPILKLGRNYWWKQPTDPAVVSNVTITGNVFDKPFQAIADGGLPLDHITITYNILGAYNTAIHLEGDITSPFKYHNDHVIIDNNTFYPGSYMDNPPTLGEGTIATQITDTRWADFSNNVADGTSAQYLQSPSDAKGWRAAFFWSQSAGNNEMMLTSQNTMTCTGDKNGDGEAISYDGSYNPTFSTSQSVLSASANTVKVLGPLPTTKSAMSTDALPSDYFRSDIWVLVTAGPGVGQMRRVTSYTSDSSGITFTVSPNWDVLPQATSNLDISQVYWQVYTIGNYVDNRSPLCLKSNRTQPNAGTIGQWGGPWGDSVIEGNQQYDSSGININQGYFPTLGGSSPNIISQYFVEIHHNAIIHEYNWDSDDSWSGIWAAIGAAPSSPPPVIGYGVSIGRNTIVHADGLHGGGISEAIAWYAGPPPYNWKAINNTLIYHNTLQDLSGPPPTGGSDWTQTTRIGINLTTQLIHNTVLFANTFNNVTTPLVDLGINTVQAR